MLDFIVLGIVPGTHFVVTLWWALLLSLIFCLSILIYIELRKNKKTKRLHTDVNLNIIRIPDLWSQNLVRPDQSIWIRRTLGLK